MEQFSHDLTIALEETSRCGGGVGTAGRWGFRRRTRSTGNLPCAPQPTEDSSSSAADVVLNLNEECDEPINTILSDSDDRQELKLVLSSRLLGNFESDSLNENFSPARPNTRRKRKFKRMAVEYETTPSTPGYSQPTAAVAITASASSAGAAAAAATAPVTVTSAVFPTTSNVVKKRNLKQSIYSPDNIRPYVFFCGKRKRSHRSYYDHNDHKLHSSSVPRQRDLFTSKNSYADYRNRRCYGKQPCERILPLNKSIISKIEKISKETKNKLSTDDGDVDVDCTNANIDCDDIDSVNIENTTSQGIPQTSGYKFSYIPIRKTSDDGTICGGGGGGSAAVADNSAGGGNNLALYLKPREHNLFYAAGQITNSPVAATTLGGVAQATTSTSTSSSSSLKIPKKSDSFESTFGIQQFLQLSGTSEETSVNKSKLLVDEHKKVFHPSQNLNHHSHHHPHHQQQHHHHHHQYHYHNHHHHHHHSDDVRKSNAFSKKLRKKMQQLQFDDPNAMECSSSGTNNRFNEFLSSSSLSSSDSEAGETNESDREGDDELTDWPGNEAMVNFTSKNDFKRARPRFILPTTNPVVSAGNPPSTGMHNNNNNNNATTKLPQINSDEFGQDEDTLMSADELNTPIFSSQMTLGQQEQPQPPNTLNLTLKYLPATSVSAITGTTITQTAENSSKQTITQLIPVHIHYPTNQNKIQTIMNSPFVAGGVAGSVRNDTIVQMSSDETTLNPNFVSSSAATAAAAAAATATVNEVRELRAGCRRVHEDRPGFTILTSVNEQLAKFLQANTESQLKLPDTDEQEHEKLIQLAKLYSLNMIVENGCAILTKTSNTTQSVNIDPRGFPGKFSIDFKRRCYDNDV